MFAHLAHEAGNDPVELAAPETIPLLVGTQLQEVGTCHRDDISAQLYYNLTNQLLANLNIKVNLRGS